MDDGREAVDALQQDMRDHELRHGGGEVHAARNQALAAEAVERAERERADAPFVPMPFSFDRDQASPPPGREHREGQHGRYIVDRSGTDDTKFRPATEAEHRFMTHALPRVEMLLTKPESGPLGQPSWRDRVLAVMELRSRVPGLKLAGLHDIAADTERRFTFELMQLLEESNAAFGDWKADKARRVQVG